MIAIPDECVRFIRMQRSRYSEPKVPDPEQCKARYAAHVAEDFAGMVSVLPERVDSILEIGCGMAAIQVHLKQRYPGARLELLDGDTDNGKGGAGYSETPDIYNSRAHTEMLLAANGVSVSRWHDVGTKELLKADLIISMASWGYHYPFAMYRVSGLVICDLRRTTEAHTIRRAVERGGKLIHAGIKFDRYAWRE